MKRRRTPQRLLARPAVLAATLLLCVAMAPAEEQPGLIDAFRNMFTLTYDGQALAYGEGLARTPKSPLNPGNATLALPNVSITGELRPNAKLTSHYVDFELQPRLSSIYQTGGGLDQESLRGYLREGLVRAKPDDQVSVVAGREVLAWGPAFFRSPSNPYYFNNARLDPILELSGIDLARAVYSPSSNWTLTGGVVFGSGHDLVSNDAYRDSLLLKADYRGPDYLGSLIVASLRNEQAFFGGYAQATVSDAILVYGEFGTASNRQALSLAPTGSENLFLPGVNSGREATALVGGSYTFENGQSLYAEYLYNGFGYSASQERGFFRQAGAANGLIALGGSLAGLGEQSTGYAATRAQDLLGQHYLYLQYQNSQSSGGLLWRVMGAQNLVDHSAQLSFYVEQNLTDRVSLFVLGVADIGAHDSEFGALFRESLTAGLKIFVF